MSEAVKRKLLVAEEQQGRARTRTARVDDPATAIQGNTFYKIIFANDVSLEDKAKQVTQALEFTNNKEEDRAKIKEFDAFKEYLQSISEEMSKQRIKMTDTEVFAELQRVYKDFNDDLNDFIEKIQPLTDITDALYSLRQSGETRAVLEQIQADKELDAEQQAKRVELLGIIHDLETDIDNKTEENFHLAQQKSFFGFGQIKADAKAKMLSNEASVEKIREKIAEQEQALKVLDDEISIRTKAFNDSFEAQKLKELLDLTTEEHTMRQADMVQAALKFVNEGKERFGMIRGHLDKMVGQIEGLGDNNNNMLQIFAIMNDATKNAEETHKNRRQQLEAVPTPENLVEKMKHDEECRNLDEHIDTVATATVDTMQTFGELTTEEIKIRNMQAATKRQVESARAMHSRGIASVASQLSVVVTAVNSAAINEAQAMASNTLATMAKVTNDIAKKEAIRIATGRDEINNDLEEMLETLASFGDTQKEATTITREALETMRVNLAEIEALAKDVQGDTNEFVGVAGDVISKSTKKEAAKTSSSMFKNI